MEASDVVPKSFGCFSHKSLKLSLNSFRSSKYSTSSNLSSPSPRSPISPNVKQTTSTCNKQDVIIKQVFCRFDGNNDGKISALELRSYFASIGEYMSHEEAQGVIDDIDSDGDSLIDFEDFKKLMTTRRKGQDEVNDEDIKGAFEMFEMEKGCGRITPRSLQRMLSRLGEAKSYDDCVSMIRVFDTDGDGELDFHEFYQMMV